ncbi:uro-adherence factor A-like [Clytia hemisphaerica]|uniref:uro-adherence factor A-like n=1 Tax=Clytia hemisphaerica TaxID=252671 RepID=UPI0034D5E48C
MFQDEDADVYYGATQRNHSCQPRYRAASRSHHPRPYQNGPPPWAIRYPYYESNHYAYHRPPQSQPPPQRWERPRYPRPSSFTRPPWINHSAYESSERWRQQNYKSFSTHETKSQNNFVDDSKRKENSSYMAVSTNKNINNDICNSDPKCKENGATSCRSGNSSSSKSDGKSELREKVSKATTNESVNSKSDRKPECEEVTSNESLNSSTKSAGKLECKESVSTPTSNKSDNSSTKNDEKSAPKVKTLKATSSKSVSLSTKRDGISKCRKKIPIYTSCKCSMHLNTNCVMCKEDESSNDKHDKQRADILINKAGRAERVMDASERNTIKKSTEIKRKEISESADENWTKNKTNTCLIETSSKNDCLTKPKEINQSNEIKIEKSPENTNEMSSEKVLLTKSKENNVSLNTKIEEHSKDLSNDDHSARGPLWIKKTYSPERRTDKYEQISLKVCVEDEKFPQNATHENLGSAMVETNDVAVSFKNENIIGIKPAFLTERSNAWKEKSWLWARKIRDNICQRKVNPSGKKSHLKSENFSTCNNSVNDVHLEETGVEFVIENKLPKDDDQNTNIVKNECLKNEKLKADHLKSEKSKDENPTKYLKNDNLLKNIPENENLSENTRDTEITKSTNIETVIKSINTKEASSIKDISTDRSKSMLRANSINDFPRGIDKTNDNPTTNNETLVVENSSVEKDTLKNVHTTLLNLSSKELAKSKTKKEKLKEAISFKISQIGNKFTDTMRRSTQLKNALKKSQSVKNIQESTNKLVTEGSGLQSQPSNVDQENSSETHTEVGTPTKPHPAKKTFELPSDVEASNLFCPECRRVQSTNIIDHLQTKHNYNQRAALFEYSKQKAIQVCTTEHGNGADHIPLPCYECNSWFCDIKSHMKSQHGNVEFDIEELNRLKTKHWQGADTLSTSLRNVHAQPTLFRCCECLDEVEETEFKDHLRKQHDYEYDEASLEHSKQFCIHTCLTKHKGYHQPLPCRKCNKWTCRLDKHMLRNHSCFVYKQRIAALDKGRILYWKSKSQPSSLVEHYSSVYRRLKRLI